MGAGIGPCPPKQGEPHTMVSVPTSLITTNTGLLVSFARGHLYIVIFDDLPHALLYRTPHDCARDGDILHAHAHGLEYRHVASGLDVLDDASPRRPGELLCGEVV